MNGKNDKIIAVIFDVDGTLIDTETIYTRIFNEIFAQFDKGPISMEFKGSIMGLPPAISLQKIIDHYSLPLEPAELSKLMDPLEIKYFAEVEPLPGAAKLVKELASRGIPMALATASSSDAFVHKTSHLSYLFQYFSADRIIRGDHPDLKRGKPNPDIFLLAAKSLGIEGEEACAKVLVFEDGLNGVIGAKRAGMQVIWVPDVEYRRVLSQNDIDALGQTVVELQSLEDFKIENWGL
ncbi:HAD family hydrolase [Atractiella rhizophila]|nr:HAD family hydrolase [Atractiella rhizophila]